MSKTKKIVCIVISVVLLICFCSVSVFAETKTKYVDLTIVKAQAQALANNGSGPFINMTPIDSQSPFGGVLQIVVFPDDPIGDGIVFDTINANMYFDKITFKKGTTYTFNLKLALKYDKVIRNNSVALYDNQLLLCDENRSVICEFNVGDFKDVSKWKKGTLVTGYEYAFYDVSATFTPKYDRVGWFFSWWQVYDYSFTNAPYWGISDCTLKYEYDGTEAIIQNNNSNTDKIINNNNSNTDKIVNNNNSNTNKITSNADKNTDKITSNQNANTDKLIEHNESMYEKEKEETQNSGNDSVDSVSDAIPSDNNGFINALGQLSSCLVTSSKTCRWNFPRVYLPAINGVINKEIELIPSTKIDFNYWINLIPSTILKLIQILCTLALIIYCFKELYDTISYIMTLRKGSSE